MKRYMLAAWILLAWMPVDAAPCTNDAQCGPWICEFPVGDCARQNGTCVPTPTCDSNSGPVCGCNDDGSGPETYADACEALDASDVVASLGLCPGWCGGQSCTENTFCQLPSGVCGRGMRGGICLLGQFGEVLEEMRETAGICTPIPTSCPQDSEPVCGCDRATYLNSCVAAQNRASIIKDEPCFEPVGGCGGFAGFVCNDPNSFCIGGCWGCGNTLGVCFPEVTCDNSCAPVCACGDVWYRNYCEWMATLPKNSSAPAATNDLAGCGEVWGVLFTTKTELFWGSRLTGNQPDGYNVYRTTLIGGVPPSWDCVASGLMTDPHQVSGAPPFGETWAFLVTKVDGGVEGPLGWGGSGCTERTNVLACSP